ncbi:hypothetical protein FQA39_LY00551 [Lamprigera yunnana]|nr:hypothetical protein FQA39_LY00551 [Lamprigera yunnana]
MESVGMTLLTQQEGFDSSQPEEVTLEELYTMEDDARISLEIYGDYLDIDGAIPGGSITTGIQKQAATTPSGSRSPASFTLSTTSSISRQSSISKKSLKPIEVFAKMQNELRSESEDDED